MTSPVPEPDLPSNSALIRPLVGHAHVGDGSEGGGGMLRFGLAAGLAGARADALPGGRVSRMTWPG